MTTAANLTHLFARFDVPVNGRTFLEERPSSNERFAVGGEGDTGHRKIVPGKILQQLPGRSIPHGEGLVEFALVAGDAALHAAPRCQRLSFGPEGQANGSVGVSLEAMQLLAAGRVPQVDALGRKTPGRN